MAAETTLVIAVSHRVRALVRVATRLVVADLAAALRDQPAVAEVIAWAAAVSAAGAVAGVAAVGVVAEVGDKQRRKNYE